MILYSIELLLYNVYLILYLSVSDEFELLCELHCMFGLLLDNTGSLTCQPLSEQLYRKERDMRKNDKDGRKE